MVFQVFFTSSCKIQGLTRGFLAKGGPNNEWPKIKTWPKLKENLYLDPV